MVDLFGRLGGGVEMNGSEDAVEKMLPFDAQKGKGNHVRYILGKSKMLLGFCEGLPTMLKGEVAMFKIKPKLHYAKDDCTLKASDGFPKDDELHFEIEMLDFYKVKSWLLEPLVVLDEEWLISCATKAVQFEYWLGTKSKH